ncbi:MAG TPA: regulatory protein RecX [Spirochaetia bacterium]|nr:regulatory protein RecX [Spirochaetia bacterium]
MAQEKNSSSPKDKLVISSIDEGGVGREKVRIALSDGSSFFILKNTLLLEGLHKGDELDSRELGRILLQSSNTEAQSKALSFLARAPHSREGLRLKLLKRRFPTESIDFALKRMEEMEYLDDRKFAEDWLASRMKHHPEGKGALLAGLLKRGVPREVAVGIVDRRLSREEERICAEEYINRTPTLRSLDRRKVARKLVSRGFSTEIIYEILRSWHGGQGEETGFSDQ